MSCGGHWDYEGWVIQDRLQKIANDAYTIARFPRLSKVLLRLGEVLYDMENKMDYDFGGDELIEYDSAFERTTIEQLRAAVGAKKEIGDYEAALEKMQQRLDDMKEQSEDTK